MSIKVCDAIMGSGKSSAAINYMNAHPDRKFIYITPFLDGAARIRESCPDLHFVEPNGALPEFSFKKYVHTFELIKRGANIASTHNMFLRYTDDMTKAISEHGYTLIIDEAVDVLRPSDVKKDDLDIMIRMGWCKRDNDGVIHINPDIEYEGNAFNEIISVAKGNRLVYIGDDENSHELYYWLFSKDILTAFQDVYVLTYLFDSQMMKYCFDFYKLGFEKIGISVASGSYQFSDKIDYIPEYTKDLSSKIHIFENKRLNKIGERKTALSATWYLRHPPGTAENDQLHKYMNSFFMYYFKDYPVTKRLWAVYKTGESSLRGRGYYFNNLAFNAKATNEFRDRTVLAYMVNIFMQPNERRFLADNGVEVLDEEYALSVMLQWIWRSAIRDGKEIWLYIPSKRMRTLLKQWIKDTEEYYLMHKGELNIESGAIK